MALQEQTVEYRDGQVNCIGWFCYDDAYTTPLPAVLISHAFGGRDEFVERKARRLAWHGYAAFALDMYGDNKRGTTPQESSALMQPFLNDRAMLARRIQAALATLKSQSDVDPNRVAAMGFCFGGLCVLDLARSGADVRGVVSFHGLLKPPPQTATRIPARVLVMHGHEDPMAPPDDVRALQEEFTRAGADWQTHAYGGTKHAFTNPNANDHARGTVYNEAAERRSWHTLMNFLEEVLR